MTIVKDLAEIATKVPRWKLAWKHITRRGFRVRDWGLEVSGRILRHCY